LAVEDVDNVDFIITLGGDGTVLYMNSIFQKAVPPTLCFNLGSLGFLTPFRIIIIILFLSFSCDLGVTRFKKSITKVMKGESFLTLRGRLQCELVRFHGKDHPETTRKFSFFLADFLCFF